MSEVNIGNTRQQIAAELKRVREACGLSQEQLAARLGMRYAPGGRRVSTGRAAVSAWESGRRTPPAQYLKAYVDLGGDPAILTAPHDAARTPRPRAQAPSTPPAAPVLDRESADAASAPGTPARRRARRRWLVPLSIILAAACGAAVLLATASTGAQGPAPTWTETTGTPAHTWADPTQLTGAETPLGPRQSVQVLCRVRGYVVQDGDPWWYRLASAPYNGHYYATSDAFYNNGAVSGSVDTGVVVDEQVPVC